MSTVALFVHQPQCSVQSVNGIIKALGSKYKFKIFTKQEIEIDFFDDVDIVAFPGGIGDSDTFEFLLRANLAAVNEFLDNGGRYLGICMGAYWAGAHYFGRLNALDAVQYIKRPSACTKRPHAKGMPIVWNGTEESMYFFDGCTFVGNGKYDVVATYSNNEPMAIIQDKLGLIGCHPESEKSWYDYHSWMPKHWHEERHHTLLLNFVDELMKR